MLKKCLIVSLLVGGCAAIASAQDAKTALGSVSKSLGADTLKTVQFRPPVSTSRSGRIPTPAHRGRSSSRRATPGPSISKVRPPASIACACRARTHHVVVVSSHHRRAITDQRGERGAPWVQQLEIWMMPHGFVRAAAARNATLDKAPGGAKQTVISFVGDNKASVKAFVDEKNLIARVETMIDHPVLGDMPFEAIYSDYKDVGDGVQFPMHIVQRQGGHPIFDLRLTDVKSTCRSTPSHRRARRCAGRCRSSGQSARPVRKTR